MAIALSQILGVLGLPKMGVDALLSLSHDPFILKLIILLILLVAGMLMETTPIILLLTPLLVPLGLELGFHPIHFGVVVVTALAIGFVTPPVGLNLFVASSITGVSVSRIALLSVPMIIGLILVLLFVTFIPSLSLALLPPK